MFPDLTDPDVESALALVHQRFSTNTFPSWPLAHPYRYVAHNGEINTLRGNINWMRAREALCRSEALGEDLRKVLPVTREGLSDTATFDNVLEFLVMNGRSLPHAILMMIPEPWQNHESMSPERRAFYEYHSSLMEPWDGPASIAFTDGTRDRGRARPQWPAAVPLLRDQGRPGRHGLRGGRARHSAAGHPGQGAPASGPHLPGRHRAGADHRRRGDQDPAGGRASLRRPGSRRTSCGWRICRPIPCPRRITRRSLTRQIAFGYTHEDLRILLGPMAKNGEEPIGSMGTDTALAVLSDRPRPLYDYFKQLFAQVTNPPLDQIREELVTSMESTIGPEGNLLKPTAGVVPADRHQGPGALQRGSGQAPSPGAPVVQVGDAADALPGRRRARPASSGRWTKLQAAATQAIADGHNIVILSDRGVTPQLAAIPSLLATAAVHHHLVRRGERTRCGLVIETGDAREVHHMCLLIGYGAGAVNPWVAFETLDDMIRQELLPGVDHAKAVRNYIKALNKGILKVMAKMGISTLQSYCGAQIFEAIGLNRDLVDRYFTGTASRVSGIGIDVIAEEVRRRHADAFPTGRPDTPTWTGAASTSGAATASTTCSTPTRSSSSSTPRAPDRPRSSATTPSWSTTRASGWPRCAA